MEGHGLLAQAGCPALLAASPPAPLQPLSAALVALDKVWDSAFSFDGPASALGSPVRAGEGAASTAGAATARPASAGSSLSSPSPTASPDQEGWVGEWLRSGSSRRSSYLRRGSGGHRRNSLTRRRSLGRRAPDTGSEAGEAGSAAAAPPPPTAPSAAAEPLAQDFELAAVVEEEETCASACQEGSMAERAATPTLPYLGELYLPSLGLAVAAHCPPNIPTQQAAGTGGFPASQRDAISLQNSTHAEEGGSVDDAELECARGWTAQAEAAEKAAQDADAETAAQAEPQLNSQAGDGYAPAACTSAGVQTDLPQWPPAEGQTEGQLRLPTAGSPCRQLCSSSSGSSSGSSLDVSPILLRVPRGAAALLRSPAACARISPAQLRHLESLRRQRAQQEAEALECLPSALRLRRAAESDAAAAETLLRRQHRLNSEEGVGAEAGSRQDGTEAEAGRAVGPATAARQLVRRPGSAGGKARRMQCLSP